MEERVARLVAQAGTIPIRAVFWEAWQAREGAYSRQTENVNEWAEIFERRGITTLRHLFDTRDQWISVDLGELNQRPWHQGVPGWFKTSFAKVAILRVLEQRLAQPVRVRLAPAQHQDDHKATAAEEEEADEEEEEADEEEKAAEAFDNFPHRIMSPLFLSILQLLDSFIQQFGPGRGNHDHLYITEATFHAELYHILRSQGGHVNRVFTEYRSRDIQPIDATHAKRHDLGIELIHPQYGNQMAVIEIKHSRFAKDFNSSAYRKDMVRLALSDTKAKYFVLCMSPRPDKGAKQLDWTEECKAARKRVRKSFPVKGNLVILPEQWKKLIENTEDEWYYRGVNKIAIRCVRHYQGAVSMYWVWQVVGCRCSAAFDAQQDENSPWNPVNDPDYEEFWD